MRAYLIFLAGALLTGGFMFGARGQEEAAAATEMIPAETIAAPVTNAPAGLVGRDFSSFRLIAERNIFNQNRAPRATRRETSRPRAPSRVHSLSLVGTMSYSKGELAFFDGSSAEFKKSVKAGELIAGYEVRQILPSSVKVGNATQEFDLRVGEQLRREDEGEWQLSTAPVERAAAANGAAGESDGGKTSTGDDAEDEALKRLMEKRAKELDQ
jgi:hypothetical protein